MGFERVSSGVGSGYRQSVAEADLARNIDHGSLVPLAGVCPVVTAREKTARRRSGPKTSLRDAIVQSMKGTTDPARLDQVRKLEREFRAFTKIFAEIPEVKDGSTAIAQNRLTRSATTLRYKLDDLPSTTDDSELQAMQFGARKS